MTRTFKNHLKLISIKDTFVKLDADQLPPASNADESDDEFEFIA